MNRCDYLDPALAWTGVKDTGRGAALSTIGYESLTRPKSFHLRESDLPSECPEHEKERTDCATGTTRPRCASAPGASSELGEA